MNYEEIMAKMSSIINETFDTDYAIQAETSAEDVDEWDSISHIELIANLEAKFNVRFALGELQDLKNVGEMANLIAQKLAS